MHVPFTPGFDLKGFEEQQFQEAAPAPLCAMQNGRWQAEHVAMLEVLTAPLKMRVRLKAERVRE